MWALCFRKCPTSIDQHHRLPRGLQACVFTFDSLYWHWYWYRDFPHFWTVKYSPQYIWLKKELKKVDREKTPWLIVLMHVPLYNSNKAHFMEGESMRSVFEKYFVKFNVDLVFAGHVHAYERSVSHRLLCNLNFTWSSINIGYMKGYSDLTSAIIQVFQSGSLGKILYVLLYKKFGTASVLPRRILSIMTWYPYNPHSEAKQSKT